MVQRFRFIGITALSILVLTIIGAVSLSPAYAVGPVTMTLNVSPNPALPGQAVTFSGQVTPPATGADNIEIGVGIGLCEPTDIRVVWLAVNLAPSGIHSTFVGQTFTGTANSAGHYSITVPGGFAAGLYGAIAVDTSYTAVGAGTDCDPFTVAPPIPEYPFGLAVLAAFMVIAYGVIRRKTVTKQK